MLGLAANQPSLLQEAKRWLGPRKLANADAHSEDFERGNKVIRRIFIGQVTESLDGWAHLRTVLRVQTDVFNVSTGELRSSDERYLISSLPSARLTAQHWLLVARRHVSVHGQREPLESRGGVS